MTWGEEEEERKGGGGNREEVEGKKKVFSRRFIDLSAVAREEMP